MNRLECAEVCDILPAYEDDELPAAERAAVAQHLQGCGGCRAVQAELQALRRRIRVAGTFVPEPALVERVCGAIGLARRGRTRAIWTGFAQPFASHAAIGVLAAVLAWWGATRHDAATDAARQVVAAHVSSLLADTAVQVASADTHTVRPWFAGRLPYAPAVVDLTPQGYPLLGGRVDFVLDRPVAALVYERRKHRINLFVLPREQVAVDVGGMTRERHGYNVVGWHAGAFAYFAASDLNAVELLELAALLKDVSAR